jgi:hypothetical protein
VAGSGDRVLDRSNRNNRGVTSVCRVYVADVADCPDINFICLIGDAVCDRREVLAATIKP